VCLRQVSRETAKSLGQVYETSGGRIGANLATSPLSALIGSQLAIPRRRLHIEKYVLGRMAQAAMGKRLDARDLGHIPLNPM
jgi:hypothetical protein